VLKPSPQGPIADRLFHNASWRALATPTRVREVSTIQGVSPQQDWGTRLREQRSRRKGGR